MKMREGMILLFYDVYEGRWWERIDHERRRDSYIKHKQDAESKDDDKRAFWRMSQLNGSICVREGGGRYNYVLIYGREKEG